MERGGEQERETSRRRALHRLAQYARWSCDQSPV